MKTFDDSLHHRQVGNKMVERVKSNPMSNASKSRKRTGYRGRRRPQRQPKSPFLALPAELRLAIYSYCIPNGRVLIQASHPNKEYQTLKKVWNPDNERIDRPRTRLGHLLDNNDIDDRLEVSVALLLVSKKVNREVTNLYYGQLSLCFDSMKVVRLFMNRVGSDNLKAVKKLELHHEGYGQPEKSKDESLKDTYDRNWHNLCMSIAERMPALESLKLNVAIFEWPATLRSDDRWYRALMELAPTKLNKVEVALTHKGTTKERLSRAAKRVENAMMTQQGIEVRDENARINALKFHNELEAAHKVARRQRLKQLPPVQASKVLTITIPRACETTMTGQVKKVEKKYYNSKRIGYNGECVYGKPWDPNVW